MEVENIKIFYFERIPLSWCLEFSDWVKKTEVPTLSWAHNLCCHWIAIVRSQESDTRSNLFVLSLRFYILTTTVYMMDVARLSITNNDIWRCKQQPKTNIVCLEESFVNITFTFWRIFISRFGNWWDNINIAPGTRRKISDCQWQPAVSLCQYR